MSKRFLQPGSKVYQAPCLKGTGVFSRGKSDWSIKFTTHPHLAPRLGMSGAIPLRPYIPSCSGQTKTSSILTFFKHVKNLPYEDFTSWTHPVFSTVKRSDLILLKNFLVSVNNVVKSQQQCHVQSQFLRLKLHTLK